MSHLKQGTWIVVADGEKALFLENTTDDAYPMFKVVEKDEQENPSDVEQSANKPGRMGDTGIGQRSSLEDTDWHELAKERFADDLAERLYKYAHKHKFKELVIVAAPQVLGEVRKALHKEVSSKVVAEVPKTLTNHPIDEIEARVKEQVEAA